MRWRRWIMKSLLRAPVPGLVNASLRRTGEGEGGVAVSIRNYRDFVILTDYMEGLPRDEENRLPSYTLRVFDSPVGEGERNEEVPIPDWDQLEKWRKSLANRNIAPQDLERFSQRLGALILPPYARQMYFASLQRLDETEGLRIRLRLLQELAFLPWEYALAGLHEGEAVTENHWALDFRLSIVRHEPVAIPAPAFRSNPKRRVIVAMASPEPYTEFQKLELCGEQQAIKEELREVRGLQAEYQPDFDKDGSAHGATEESLRRALREPADVFHFSGHGLYRAVDGTSAIVLADSGNQADMLDSDELRSMLTEGYVRLVILDACESGGRDMYHRWSSLAMALLRGGMPAVVAMQYSVYDDLAKEFAKKLYEYLVAGLTIDEAVTQGRRAMYRKRPQDRDWGTPVLYLRNSGGNIFPPVTDEQARIEAEQDSDRDMTLGEVTVTWVRKGILANPAQLQMLQAGGDALGLTPADAVLLLSSAVQGELDSSHWVAQLRRVGARWIKDLQAKPLVPPDQEMGPAEKQLGLDVRSLGPVPPDVDVLTWSAVSHPDSLRAQTAALTVLAAQPDKVIGKVQDALRYVTSGSVRRRRRAMLLGCFAEADSAIADNLPHELDNLEDRLAVWWWRARRHFHRSRRVMSCWGLGGALGGCIALAIYRGGLAVFNSQAVGTEFAINSYWGFLVSLGLVVGILIARPLLLQDVESMKAEKSRRVELLSILLGAIGFSLTDALVAWMNGVYLTSAILGRYLVTGFLAGAGLGLGLAGQPWAGWRLGLGGWLKRLGAASITLAVTQLPVLCQMARRPDGSRWLENSQWLAATIIEPSQILVNLYRFYPPMDALFRQGRSLVAGGCCYAGLQGAPLRWSWLFAGCFAEWMSVLDAALVGIVITVGVTIGLHFSETWLGRIWARFARRLSR
jgi:CHAT domain